LYILHVAEKGFSLFEAAEKREARLGDEVKRILVFFGDKARGSVPENVRVSLVGSVARNAAKRICEAVTAFNIQQLCIGRRSMGLLGVVTTSTSKHVLENADCNIVIGKPPTGAHTDDKGQKALIDSQNPMRLGKTSEDKMHFTLYQFDDSNREVREPEVEIPEQKTKEIPEQKTKVEERKTEQVVPERKSAQQEEDVAERKTAEREEGEVRGQKVEQEGIQDEQETVPEQKTAEMEPEHKRKGEVAGQRTAEQEVVSD